MSSSRFAAILSLVLLLAAILRLAPLILGTPAHHPDEFNFVYWPLYFFSGNLNPQHTVTAFYPALQYYLLGILYLGYFGMLKLTGVVWTLDHFVAYSFFWGTEELLAIARWTGSLFSVGTVFVTAMLARELCGRAAAAIAGMLLAVCSLHVRQSPLAAVDVPMTFWYTAAMYSSVRLMSRGRIVNYLVAGGLVGLATATKYPGVLAATAVIAAHLLARRRLFDRRLWLAGLGAFGTFLLTSPYTLLDYAVFIGHFERELLHLQGGHGQELGLGWWYHLKVSLRYAFGWAGLLAFGLAVVTAVRRPNPTWILLSAFVVYYLVMGSGQSVFVRYALPLVVIQAVLVAIWIQRIRVRSWLLLAFFVVSAEPAYTAVRISHLLTATDTRQNARSWMETHMASGTSCCNFGGWAGDPDPLTVQDIWWKIKHFERRWGRKKLDTAIPFLISTLDRSVFNFVVGTEYAHGDMAAVDGSNCEYVLLHRHPLAYSSIDTKFADQLRQRAERVAQFDAAGLETSTPTFDPIDGYYVPIGALGDLRQPGPQIEIWRIRSTGASSDAGDLPARSFARAYASVGALSLKNGNPKDAIELALRGVKLDKTYAGSYVVSAYAYRQFGQPSRARHLLEKALSIDTANTDAWVALGNLHAQEGDLQRAAECFAEVFSIDPNYRNQAGLEHFMELQGHSD